MMLSNAKWLTGSYGSDCGNNPFGFLTYGNQIYTQDGGHGMCTPGRAQLEYAELLRMSCAGLVAGVPRADHMCTVVRMALFKSAEGMT